MVGPSRYYGDIFAQADKFEHILPVLWRAEKDTIYAIPQRTKSLAHVVPAEAIVKRQPINGLDTDEIAIYVAALDDSSLPAAPMTWRNPSHGHIEAALRAGQVLSIQNTYDKGWVALANGRRVEVTRDGIGLAVIHPDCDGECSVDFTEVGSAGSAKY